MVATLKAMIISPFIIAIFFTIVIRLLWRICHFIAKFYHITLSYTPWMWTTIGLILLCWILMAYGFFIGRFKLEVISLDYCHERIPQEFDGYKIVHISDVHLSTFDDRPTELQRFVDSVNAQNPDLICFTGDLVTIGVEEALPYTEILQQIKAKDGIISILGNHDFLIYNRSFKNEEDRMMAVDRLAEYEQDKLNWILLRNANHTLYRQNSHITLVGVNNHSCTNEGFKTVMYGDLNKAMEGTKGFRILLSHDPTHWKGEVLGKVDIPLMLSGHTHAAQIKIGKWTPATWLFKESKGMYNEETKFGKQSMYVNAGLGCTLPIRIGADAEITVITLKTGK